MLRRRVARAETFEVDLLAVLPDQQDGAGDLAGGDLAADIVAESLQRRARECRGIRRLRFGPRDLRSARWGRQFSNAS
jgi:hypothetical protein